MDKKNLKKNMKKVWHFIWEDDSIWSWLVNIALAFVLIKFVVYPGLGLMLGTSHPVVAVVSESMEHNGLDFEEWWVQNGQWYENNGVTKEQFAEFSLKNGFNKGDIMVLVGAPGDKVEIGDVIVFTSARRDPIIHRVVIVRDNSQKVFQTKGDNNRDSIKTVQLDETNITENRIIGKAVIRIPMLGYIKIGFVELLQAMKLA